MKDIVTVDIAAAQAKVAALFADPANNPKWMEGLERYQPISGEPGAPGSTYRLVQQGGKLDFLAKVVVRDLPDEVRLTLDADSVAVRVRAQFLARANATRLVSTEQFKFKGLFGPVVGLLARRAIRRAHCTQMQAFKRFAEAAPA
jgi:polyketide cyclase/dehydrase/lipid transport protein